MITTYDDILNYICERIADHSSSEEEARLLIAKIVEDLPLMGWKTRIQQSRAKRREWEKRNIERRKEKHNLNPEFYIVQAQCMRAKKAGVTHDLTLEQWIAAIEHFNGLCAYCKNRSYQALEHYLSIPLGGTTASNCVPACHACNNLKRNRTPEQLAEVFPKKNLDHINEFLAKQKTHG